MQTENINPAISYRAAYTGFSLARFMAALNLADTGNLAAQHVVFSEMEVRDAHLLAEINKRKTAIAGLDWTIIPPRHASEAEKNDVSWLITVLQSLPTPLESLIFVLADGIGRGFACVEIEWYEQDGMLLPDFHPRPQEWFIAERDEIRLNTGKDGGGALRPMGWICHKGGAAKTGEIGRLGLYRGLVPPFLYKAFALGALAEYTEQCGMPLVVGTYPNWAGEEAKQSLFAVVNQLGHNARAVLPSDFDLHITQLTSDGGHKQHAALIEWAEQAESKLILGATLTSQGDSRHSTGGLGAIHEKVRMDILESDARRMAATLSRQLIYPLLYANRGYREPRRCPKIHLDASGEKQATTSADAMAKLAALMPIPVSWARAKTGIPAPQDGEPILWPGVLRS